MPPGDLAPVIVSSVIAVAVALIVILRGPVGRALGRRIEGLTALPDPATGARIDELLDRVGELEQQAVRVHELEERLDFAERLLAQGRAEAGRLDAGRVEGIQ